VQEVGGEWHLLRLRRTQLEQQAAEADGPVQLLVQTHPHAHQYCGATPGRFSWAPVLQQEAWRKKKKAAAVSIPDCKRITVHRESNHNLQHDGRL
jgi:hypothetical protein